MGLGTELSGVGMAAISSYVLGLLCEDGVWMGKLRPACRAVLSVELGSWRCSGEGLSHS